jgi:hypothetical protein
MKISVYQTINDGNLGDTWKDSHKAAKALAAYTERLYTQEIKALVGKAQMNIDIRVNRNTSGATHLNVECADHAVAARVEALVEQLRHQAWESWCDTDEAERLSA